MHVHTPGQIIQSSCMNYLLTWLAKLVKVPFDTTKAFISSVYNCYSGLLLHRLVIPLSRLQSLLIGSYGDVENYYAMSSNKKAQHLNAVLDFHHTHYISGTWIVL